MFEKFINIIGYACLLLVCAVQIPAWLWAKVRGREYEWWEPAH